MTSMSASVIDPCRSQLTMYRLQPSRMYEFPVRIDRLLTVPGRRSLETASRPIPSRPLGLAAIPLGYAGTEATPIVARRNPQVLHECCAHLFLAAKTAGRGNRFDTIFCLLELAPRGVNSNRFDCFSWSSTALFSVGPCEVPRAHMHFLRQGLDP